jgi:nitrate/nitrite-specific signal transduction histidine kinase
MPTKLINYIVPTADDVRPNEILTRYIVAIVLIFATVTFAHIATNKVLESNHELANAINESGRQRMLSQRIQFMASAFISSNLTDETAKKNMEAAVNLFEKSHNALVASAQTFTQSGDPLYERYLGQGGDNLDKTSNQFITNTNALLQVDSSNFQAANTAFWSFNAEQLLSDLNSAVGEFESLSISATQKAESVALKSYALAVIVLLFELIFIFIPAHITIRQVLLDREALPIRA